ncbi:MAG: hypothetical protein NTY33_03170 [Candidatus Moranbacteria bacterium]|nr:hypothetical protein [Candidatus Moranbacteria bacterium]
MVPRGYLWLVRIVGLFALGALIFIVLKTEPEKDTGTKIFFYLAFFFFLGSLFNLFLLRLRRSMMRGELAGENIVLSLRQGALLALFATSLLVLQGLRMLLWWDGLLIVAGIFLVELYFLSGNDD